MMLISEQCKLSKQIELDISLITDIEIVLLKQLLAWDILASFIYIYSTKSQQQSP